MGRTFTAMMVAFSLTGCASTYFYSADSGKDYVGINDTPERNGDPAEVLLHNSYAVADSTPTIQADLNDGSGLKSLGLGLLLGAGGAYIGYRFVDKATKGDCCQAELVALVIGESVGMAFGAHLGNHRKGSFVADLLVSSAVGAGGMAVGSNAKDFDTMGVVLLMAPIVQVIATVLTEREIGLHRSRGRNISLYTVPRIGGGVAFGASVALSH